MRRVIAKGTPPDQIAASIAAMVSRLDPAQSWQVSIEAFKPKRSDRQNAFLWSVVYPSILEGGGEALRGWSTTDLHEYFLGEIYGWEMLEGMGRKRMKPVKRSSRMTRSEFMDYLEQISQRCANLGIVIPEPTYETA